MHIPFLARLISFFTRDKYDFWWKYFSDEEKKLKRMDAWQLIEIIQNARQETEQKCIVAEHMLSIRLARIQSKASWDSGFLGFLGAIISASLSITIANTFYSSNNEGSCYQKVHIKSTLYSVQYKERLNQ
ncbi:MAG: hypothetical protein ACU4EQ_12855 [Candidatus Nitrosoglobus sp.]